MKKVLLAVVITTTLVLPHIRTTEIKADDVIINAKYSSFTIEK